jgi:phosphohistidine phosphatase
MELYILRHAIAVARGGKRFRRDSDRPLTDEGIAKLREVVRGMRALGLSFDLILSSPFRRARQTAEILAGEMGLEEALGSSPHLAPGGDARGLIDQINAARKAAVLLVGHEPGLGQLISVLLAGDEGTRITVKKASLCKLVAPTLRYARCASLEWLLAPAQLKRIR